MAINATSAASEREVSTGLQTCSMNSGPVSIQHVDEDAEQWLSRRTAVSAALAQRRTDLAGARRCPDL